VLSKGLAGPRGFINCLQAHPDHQPPDAVPPDIRAFPAQIGRDPKNGYFVYTRSNSFIIASVSSSTLSGVS